MYWVTNNQPYATKFYRYSNDNATWTTWITWPWTYLFKDLAYLEENSELYIGTQWRYSSSWNYYDNTWIYWGILYVKTESKWQKMYSREDEVKPLWWICYCTTFWRHIDWSWIS